MPKFPYMNFPFPYYNNRRFSTHYTNSHLQNSKQYFNFEDNPSLSSPDTASNLNSFENCTLENQKNKSNNSNEDYLFDLFGLKIYTDDVLLVSLIYFLYSENVKDEGLFIVLILLLLS